LIGSSQHSPLNTFVVRLWLEASGSGMRWRGRVEHVQSGQSISFRRTDELVGFVQLLTGLAPESTRDEPGTGCHV
jgi:hypothetical protein